MLDGLQAEIENWPILSGAGHKIMMSVLNEPGSASVEAWITSPTPVLKSLNEIYTYYVSDETLGKLLTLLSQEGNEVLALRLDKATHLDLTTPLVINLLGQLLSGGICTQSEHDALLRLGQIQKSRAEELFGRKLTLEDFK